MEDKEKKRLQFEENKRYDTGLTKFYAYRHKSLGNQEAPPASEKSMVHGAFGILEAVSWRDARRHLGNCYEIKKSPYRSSEIGVPRGIKWALVQAVFQGVAA